MVRRNNGVNFFDAYKDVSSYGVGCQLSDGRWVPCRPIGWTDIPHRLQAVWLVWTGRADVLLWEGQERSGK